MKLASDYILILAKYTQQAHFLMTLLGDSRFSATIAYSEEQAIIQVKHLLPFLIILAGDHYSWSQNLLSNLRSYGNTQQITLVALTDFHTPSWVSQEENPGFDGFLVSPLSREVLLSLVHSAYMRQACCSLC